MIKKRLKEVISTNHKKNYLKKKNVIANLMLKISMICECKLRII